VTCVDPLYNAKYPAVLVSGLGILNQNDIVKPCTFERVGKFVYVNPVVIPPPPGTFGKLIALPNFPLGYVTNCPKSVNTVVPMFAT
jgi:hypothetical protein